ncbi:PucR family transcriptional regulator [Bacillus sp. AK128]
MLEKLKAQFPSLLFHDVLTLSDTCEYFRMDNGQYISIQKDELTEKDHQLLSIFLTPISTNDNQSLEQTYWKKSLLTNDSESKEYLLQNYDEGSVFRLIHFQLQTEVEKTHFEEAVSSLSFLHSIFIWISPNSGVIIEEVKHETIQFEELVDLQNAVISDFYTDLYFYLGELFTLTDSLHERYEWETTCFQLSKLKLKNKNLYQFYEAIPYILLNETKEKTKYKITQLLKDIPPTDIQSIKLYIENGLNISLAAKKLFMHRNSLQYRVDKFIEKTAVDIKSFEGALVIYLAILSEGY